MKRNLIAEGPFETRRAKVAELAAGSDPSDVPLFLYALSDPDYAVSALSASRETHFSEFLGVAETHV